MGVRGRRGATRASVGRAVAIVAVAALLVLSAAQGEGAVLAPTWGTSAEAAATVPAGPVSCHDGAMQIVAHEDDDLLFLSPDLLHDIQSGRCVRTVVVTAGDAAQGTAYWKSRERGSQAAYAQMAGVRDAWTTTDAGVQGHPIPLLTLTADPRISIAFLRLPDGNRRGTGMRVHDHESLMRLWQGAIPTITAVDGSSTYTADTLTSTLAALVNAFAPTTVRTQDWTIPFQTGDNADHTATALFVRSADHAVTSAHVLLSYGGYPIWTRPTVVHGADLRDKTAAFVAYAHHDPLMCLEPWCADSVVAALRLSRQYVVASQTTVGPGAG
ncbi:PIG-L family deacetylase [Cellulomonas sp. NTE-D12]|uniref:PIG-L family deacetylase n=1 Tax=Cellulomonas sp. NTE-D12 TaxID=2962632 RepID=UPI003081FEE8